MITRAHIRNFRCLVDVEIGFEPLTILVGPNASGKSALIDALDPSSAMDASNGLHGKGTPTVFLGWDGAPLEGRQSRSYRFLKLHLDIQALRNVNYVRSAPMLDANGGNLVNVFATLSRAQRSEIVQKFTSLVPMYADFDYRPAAQDGNHRLVFQDRWQESVWYEPSQVSDGSLLLVALLILQFLPVDVVAIDEPERGLHPYLVGQLVGLLRDLARGKLGPKAIQVVLATHSAELLEFAEPEEVRFLSRREVDGATQIESAPTGSEDWASTYREYQRSLGAIWLSGSLGGVPGS